jgi:hypothetical protein
MLLCGITNIVVKNSMDEVIVGCDIKQRLRYGVDVNGKASDGARQKQGMGRVFFLIGGSGGDSDSGDDTRLLL